MYQNKARQLASASAYYNGDFYAVFPRVAPFILIEEISVDEFLKPECSEMELGRLVSKTLKISNYYRENQLIIKGHERIAIYDNWLSEVMKTYKYRTKGAIYRKMKNVAIDKMSINSSQNTIILSPLHHHRSDYWEGDKDLVDVIIPGDSGPEEIGAALREAFRRCTGPGAD